jgi:hypothetical protein
MGLLPAWGIANFAVNICYEMLRVLALDVSSKLTITPLRTYICISQDECLYQTARSVFSALD